MNETADRPTDTDGAARATSDELMAALLDLTATETKKRSMPTGSPEFLRLAIVADQVGTMVARWTAAQLDAASHAAALIRQGAMTGAPIDQVAPRPLAKILAQWREAEHRLSAAETGSPAAISAGEDVRRLRNEYHEAAERMTSKGLT